MIDIKAPLNLLIILCLWCSFSNALAEDKQLKIFVNSLNPIPPYLWVDPCSNSLEGSAVKLLEKSLGALGVSFVIQRPEKVGGADDVLGYLLNGQYEAAFISGSQLNTPGLLVVKPPIIEIRNAIISRQADKISADNFYAIKGRKGLLVGYKETNSIAIELIKKGMDVSMTQQPEMLIDAIVQGDYDYTIIDHYYAQTLEAYAANKHLLAIDFFPFAKRAVYFSFADKPGNRELVKAIGESFQGYKDSGYIDFVLYDYLRVWVGRKDKC